MQEIRGWFEGEASGGYYVESCGLLVPEAQIAAHPDWRFRRPDLTKPPDQVQKEPFFAVEEVRQRRCKMQCFSV